MRCSQCGADIQETDSFCSKCGAKVIRQRRCPGCGVLLRENTNFCHECGKRLSGMQTVQEEKTIKDDTLDIPVEEIERNILFETAAEIEKDSRKHQWEESAHREGQRGRIDARETVRGRKRDGQEEVWDEDEGEGDDWDEEDDRGSDGWDEEDDSWDEDREDDGWEEDDEDQGDKERGGVDVLTVVTVVVGCILLIVIAVIGFHYYREYMPHDYEKAEEAQGEEEGDDGEPEEDRDVETGGIGVIRIVSNVNVRDNPATQGTNIIKVAKEGETYEYYDRNEAGWYRIKLDDGSYGYVFGEYVSEVD